MNTIYHGVVALIKSAITGLSCPLPESFSLEAADELIRGQSLIPLAYRGAFNCGISTKTELMQKYQVQYFQHLVSSEKQLRAVEQICAAFEENDIDYMTLKGCNLKKLYPKPEMRSMGDADILIRLEQYERIRLIMQEMQYEDVKESPYDYCWQNADLYAELHKRLFAPTQVDLYGWFGDGWDKAHREDGHRYALSHEDEFVYIFCHMTKHFRVGGIGARHFVDLYVYRRAYPDMNEQLIEQAMSQLKLLEFYQNVRQMLAVWFEDAPADPVTDMISAYVFSSGSFGTLENKLYSEELLKAKKQGQVKNSKLKSLISAIFPPLKTMQLSYTILNQYPVLYPVFWIVRCVDVLLHKPKRIGKKLNIIQNMTDEKVTEHERAMNMMGLSFDFDYDEE